VLTALFRPALIAYLPEVVERERLAAANSLLALSSQAALLLGPAVGAGLVGLGSPTTALHLDGLSFLVAAASTVPLPARAPVSGSAGGRFAQAMEGFRTVRRVGWVSGTILLCSLANLGTIGAERLALPRAAEERYGQLGGYGAVLVALGAGAIVAALLSGREGQTREPGRIAYGGIMTLGLATVSLGLVRGILAAVVAGFAFGFGQQLADIQWITALQRYVPDRLLGRVSAVDHFGSFLLLPLSFALGGLVVQAVGPQSVLIGAGVLAVAIAAVGLGVPALHQWRPFADEAAQPPQQAPAPPPAQSLGLPVD
jgi:predicted MFS family arabinose efflux permease